MQCNGVCDGGWWQCDGVSVDDGSVTVTCDDGSVTVMG